ncbi:hypothetical protein [Mycobacterium sp. 141]|uniref:hypothetical protein n=1 Tax=Mycobacterium sp. 141 TaxID=1120797 RepID=UPI000369EFD1|nr:hypothetical protein [Mycobacterium sp. 141]
MLSVAVDAEIVAIVKAQQDFAREFLATAREPDRTPKYLFLRTTKNRLGTIPLSGRHPASTPG